MDDNVNSQHNQSANESTVYSLYNEHWNKGHLFVTDRTQLPVMHQEIDCCALISFFGCFSAAYHGPPQQMDFAHLSWRSVSINNQSELTPWQLSKLHVPLRSGWKPLSPWVLIYLVKLLFPRSRMNLHTYIKCYTMTKTTLSVKEQV